MVRLNFACSLVERMIPLYSGEIRPEGIDLNYLAIDRITDAATEYRPDSDESGMWKKMKGEMDSAAWSLARNG